MEASGVDIRSCALQLVHRFALRRLARLFGNDSLDRLTGVSCVNPHLAEL